MNDYAAVFHYLEREYVHEIEEYNQYQVDKYSKFIYQRILEFYWTLTRFVGLGRARLPAWREPALRQSEKLRVVIDGEIAAPLQSGRLLFDMTPTHRLRERAGIQRVVREIAQIGVESGAALPVFMRDGRLFSHFLHPSLPDEVTPRPGDRLFLPDAAWLLKDEYEPLIEDVRRAGGTVISGLYDLIPLRFPGAVTSGHVEIFKAWFQSIVLKSDSIVCISRTVAEDFANYAREQGAPLASGRRIGYWRLGADFHSPKATPSGAALRIAKGATPFFLSVGTLEPRKGYSVALTAFETLWREGLDVRYVIVGRIGWNTLALQRRLREHPEFGKRLFWLDDASDADLHYLYPLACALVFPSFVEGFGLPLVEAAHFGARVIASDIPVFREVGGDAVAYFDTLDSASLAKRVREALAAPKLQRALPVLSWRQSAEALFALLDGAPSPHAGWLD